MILYSQWTYIPVGYIWDNTEYIGHSRQSWYNSTGRDVTFNYSIFNIIYDDSSSQSHGSFIYISPTSSYIDGTSVVHVKGGTNGTTQTGTFTCPAGQFVCYFGQNNSFARVTVWE